MTALAGIWHLDGRPGAAGNCAHILTSQQIYGPDAEAQWSAGELALGRRLKRVLPEDIFDHQPMVRRDRVLVADVRLDNRSELVQKLEISAAEARNLCDAAILFSALERWGEDCFGHIVGVYAFAFWDGTKRSLLLARDPLGYRPLHYHRGKNLFAFASMPKGLHALAEIPRGPDEERVAEFLILLPAHGSRTFFTGIERVEPGHFVKITQSGLSVRRHWNPRRRTIKLKNPDEYSEALRAHLDEAVLCRLRGTGDVGVSMSGGLDSTAVAATAARLLASSSRRVIAFTAVPRSGFNSAVPRNRIMDEGPHAAAVAALYPNIEHVLVHNEYRSPLDRLDSAFFFNEQPLLNPCNAGWGTRISEEMKGRNIKIGLTGSCGNFGLSYDGRELMPELVRTGRWLRWLKEARHLTTHSGMRWRGVLAQSLGPWCPAWAWVLLHKVTGGYADEVEEYSAILAQRLAEFDLEARAKERDLDLHYRPSKDSFAARLWCLRQFDPGNTYLGELAGMGIDSRDPTADIRLLEFCLAVPTDMFLRDGVHRALARRALADRLPKLVLEERRIGIQAVDWFEHISRARDNLALEIERLGACPQAARTLDISRLRRLVKQWPSTGWDRAEIISAYRSALLRGISAGHFLRCAAGGNA